MTDGDALRASQRFCGRLARRAAGNFYYGFLLLPQPKRRSMCALYAFLRAADDIADGPGETAAKRDALQRMRAALDASIDESPAAVFSKSKVLPALAHAVRSHAIPLRYLHEALKGVSMDLDVGEYASFEDLHEYCYHVASTVGLCCIHVWGFTPDEGRAERLAIDCGIAFQLTNIIRDVREDAERGRVYLPVTDMTRFGVSVEQLTDDAPDQACRTLLNFEADRARAFYQRARPLEQLIDPSGRPMFRALVGIYEGLLDAIERAKFNVFGRRVALPSWRKAAIALGALTGGGGRG